MATHNRESCFALVVMCPIRIIFSWATTWIEDTLVSRRSASWWHSRFSSRSKQTQTHTNTHTHTHTHTTHHTCIYQLISMSDNEFILCALVCDLYDRNNCRSGTRAALPFCEGTTRAGRSHRCHHRTRRSDYEAVCAYVFFGLYFGPHTQSLSQPA